MWTWSLNWGQITNNIIVGTCPMVPDDLRRIRFEGEVSGVFSLQHDDCLKYWGIDYEKMYRTGTGLGLMMERCPIRDFDVKDMRRRLPTAISMLTKMLVNTSRVYVHCTAGMGRAPLTVLGYLTLVNGYSPEDAISVIQMGRPESVPAWEAYYGCCDDLVNGHQKMIERRAYELYELGVHHNAEADWYQAKAEILRLILTQGTFEFEVI